MKKLVKVLLISILAFSISFNVYADEEASTGGASQKSSDTTLKNVKVNGANVVCSKETCEYDIKDNNVSDVEITYETNDKNATVTPKKLEGKLKSGENKFTAKVQAENGEEVTYTFIVNKKTLSTDNTLKKLIINNQEVTLQKDVTKYNTTVSFAAKKIEIEATPNDSSAKIDGANNNKISYDFFDNSKEVKIKVIAESGDVKTYTISVTKREEKDASLKSLSITGAKLDFESGVYDYEITVSKSVEKIEIDATPVDSGATIKIDNPTLSIGENTVTINVDNDGNTKVYTIKVTKLDTLDSALANLKSLKVKGCELDFKEDKYVYDIKIGDINYLDIDYEVLTPGSEVDITGNMDLEDGSIVKIRVTYNDELTNVYELHVIKEVAEKNENNIPKIIIIVAIILILIAIVVLLIFKFKGKKKDLKKKENVNQLEIDAKEEHKVDIGDTSKEATNLTSETYSVDDSDIEEII